MLRFGSRVQNSLRGSDVISTHWGSAEYGDLSPTDRGTLGIPVK